MAVAAPNLAAVRDWLTAGDPTAPIGWPARHPDPPQWNDTWGRIAASVAICSSGAPSFRLRPNHPEGTPR